MLSIIKRVKPGKKLLVILLLSSLLLVMGCVTAPTSGWSGPNFSVTGDYGVIYVGTIEGNVMALDASNGQTVLWEKELEGVSSGGFACSSGISKPMSTYGKPVVYDGNVFIGGYDGYIYAFTADKGFQSDKDIGNAIVGSPIVDEVNETVIVGDSEGNLYALSTDNIETEKWIFKTGGKIWATPAVDDSGNVVYVGSSDNKLYAIDAKTGEEKWHFVTGSGIFSTPVVSEDEKTVYIGSCDNKFYAINAETGEEIWHFEAENWFWSEALIHNGEVWVGCFDYNIYVLDVETGNLLNTIETDGRVRIPPVPVKINDTEYRIIIGSEDGTVYSIDPVDKSKLELFSQDSPIFAPIYAIDPDDDPDNNIPDSENGIIYVHAQNGDHFLYAIDVETGAELWKYETSD